MNRYNDFFVAGVALLGAVLSIAISVGPWKGPYRLRSIAAVAERFGMSAARLVWLIVALISLGSGILILSGVRPDFAKPKSSLNESGQH